ncbi:MAG: preprotein translocase subunit YajC [Paracoccaceae bacterium]
MFVTPAYAQGAGGGGGDMLTSFVPLILIFVIFYFFLIRPQQKKAKAHKAMVAAVRRGDQVLTQSGIFGKVTKVKDGEDEIEVEIAPNVKIRVLRSALGSVISKGEPVEG